MIYASHTIPWISVKLCQNKTTLKAQIVGCQGGIGFWITAFRITQHASGSCGPRPVFYCQLEETHKIHYWVGSQLLSTFSWVKCFTLVATSNRILPPVVLLPSEMDPLLIYFQNSSWRQWELSLCSDGMANSCEIQPHWRIIRRLYLANSQPFEAHRNNLDDVDHVNITST